MTMLVLAASSCGGKDKDTNCPEPSETLYKLTRELIKTYSDSIQHAPDSLDLSTVFSRFNAKLDSLNFTVPPDTDLKLSEGENDTIFEDLRKLRELYEKKMNKFIITQNDTCQQSVIS